MNRRIETAVGWRDRGARRATGERLAMPVAQPGADPQKGKEADTGELGRWDTSAA